MTIYGGYFQAASQPDYLLLLRHSWVLRRNFKEARLPEAADLAAQVPALEERMYVSSESREVEQPTPWLCEERRSKSGKMACSAQGQEAMR